MDYIITLIAHWATVIFMLALEETRAPYRIGHSPRGASTLAYLHIGAGELKRLAIKAHNNPSVWALFFRAQTFDVWQERIEWAPQQTHKIIGTLNALGIKYDIIHTDKPYRVNGKIRKWQEVEQIAIAIIGGRWTATQFEKFGAGYTPDGIDSRGRYIECKSSNNGIIYGGKLNER